MVKNTFEENRSEWELNVSCDEINRVQMMACAILARRDGREFVWVKKTGPSTRRWYVEGYHVRASIESTAGPLDPAEPVAIPVNVLDMAVDLAPHDGTVTLFRNEKENVFVARHLDSYGAIDGYNDEGTEPDFDPMCDLESFTRSKHTRRVTVASDVLERIAFSYSRAKRSMADMSNWGPPPSTTLAFTPDSIRWTTDWTRWGKEAISGFAPAVTDRFFDVTFYPLYLWNFVDIFPMESDVTFGYDGTRVGLWGGDWAVWLDEVSDITVRWGERADSAFSEFGFERETTDMNESVLSYTRDDVTISLEVIEGTSGADCLRLVHMVESNMDVTETLLAETMAMSDRLVSAKLSVSKHYLSVTVDIDNIRGHDQFKEGITSMLKAVGQCGDFGKVLPLFGPDAPARDSGGI